MVIRKLLSRTSEWVSGVVHMGRVGKLAGQRSFLQRERKKILLKLGERAYEWLQTQEKPPPFLERLVLQIEKLDLLIKQVDYGGEKGVAFQSSSQKKSPRPRSGRNKKKS